MRNNFIENEHKTLKFWEEIGLLEKMKAKNKEGKPWSFLDGPITANNPMGVHHAWGRTLKDLFQRFKAMQGYQQRLQNGFDCQGLWLEVEVEKEMGFKNKKDIEKFGVENFVNKCKERAHKYSMIQTEQSIRLGMQCDWGDWRTSLDDPDWLKKSHSYYTMSDENNYAIWHFLKRCHEKGLLYKGRDSVPWCPRCGTAISQHEILQEEYKEITHKAIYFKLPIIGQPNTYFLVWTTTPWTLPGNVALAVNPDLEYVKVQSPDGNIYILVKDRANLIEGGKILETLPGKKLEGLEYKALFDVNEFPATVPIVLYDELLSDEKRHEKEMEREVILWKDITAEEGTGLVHIAPGCGAEDFQLSQEQGFYVIDLTDNDSNYREGFGELTGKFVGSDEVREWIFKNLESKGLVFKIEDYLHRYPTCWRCKTELIFRVVDEWYIAMAKPLKSKIKNQKSKIGEELREQLIESAKRVNWIPKFCLERELDWLRNMHDWLISKKRYWGLALPIFECECGNFEVIGSKEELQKRAVEGWQDFDGHSPHRPWIDEVKIKCSKCGKVISRISDVGNVWLDAGIVPFSTISNDNRSENIPYFHNQKAEWQKWFPAELVCEGFPGQFKNWFYVLLVMSQVLEGEPPFKNLLGFANVVDEKGEEMHKSKGNAIWFDEGVEKIGADVMRWMYVKQNPASDMRFGYNVAKETERKILTLINCVKFFETYARQGREIPNSKSQNPNKSQIPKSKQILDKWIVSRLNNLIKQATDSLERFDSTRASQAIEDFWINDLSLWYVRRSRKRFQNPESQEDKELAEQTFYYVLLTIAKLIAPFMPFLAEEMYQLFHKINREDPSGAPEGSSLGSPGDLAESVHLCEWPEVEKKLINEKLEQEMQQVRDIVSLALAKRMDLKIGVRQALAKLKIKNPTFAKASAGKEKLLELIKDEVNVKEIIFDDNIEGEVELDTIMTDELKEEGQVREIIRHVQDLRKKAGLTPKDIVDLHFAAQKELAEIIKENQQQISKTSKLQTIKENPARQGEFLAQKEVKIDIADIWLAIERF